MFKAILYIFIFTSLIACNSKHTSEIKQDSIKYFVREIKKLAIEPSDSMLNISFFKLNDSVKTVKLKYKYERQKGKYSYEKALSKFLNEKSYSSLDTSLVGTFRIKYSYQIEHLTFRSTCVKLIDNKLEIKEFDCEGGWGLPYKFKLLKSRNKKISKIEFEKFRELIRISELENLTSHDIENESMTCCMCSYIQLETLRRKYNYPKDDYKYIKITRNTKNKQNNFTIACNYLLDLAEVKNRY